MFGLQTSDSVTLDLLTYADLELLRNRKAGVVSRPRSSQQSSALTAKRYLILIYTVEFDRSALNFIPLKDVDCRPVLTCRLCAGSTTLYLCPTSVNPTLRPCKKRSEL